MFNASSNGWSPVLSHESAASIKDNHRKAEPLSVRKPRKIHARRAWNA